MQFIHTDLFCAGE